MRKKKKQNPNLAFGTQLREKALSMRDSSQSQADIHADGKGENLLSEAPLKRQRTRMVSAVLNAKDKKDPKVYTEKIKETLRIFHHIK